MNKSTPNIKAITKIHNSIMTTYSNFRYDVKAYNAWYDDNEMHLNNNRSVKRFEIDDDLMKYQERTTREFLNMISFNGDPEDINEGQLRNCLIMYYELSSSLCCYFKVLGDMKVDLAIAVYRARCPSLMEY